MQPLDNYQPGKGLTKNARECQTRNYYLVNIDSIELPVECLTSPVTN